MFFHSTTMKLIVTSFLLLVTTSFYFQSNLASAGPLGSAARVCEDIPNAVTDTSAHVTIDNQCKCKIGFEGPESFSPYSVDVNCTDIDECKNMMMCGDSSVCVNIIGSYQCRQCENGYINLHGVCQDVDECRDGSAKCHTIAACKNLQGSFQCLCPHGYTGNGVGDNGCLDMDECQNPLICGAYSICTNIIGSYQCSACHNGHRNVNGVCEDIDECNNAMICGADAICKNTVGSYNCSKCDQGYRNVNGECEDVDECATGKASCHEIATCINKIGFFQCLCPSGFTGDGDLVSGCKDIDECKYDPCGEGGECLNYAGSFQCYCLESYSYDKEKQRCIENTTSVHL